METFEHTKMKPLSITIAVIKQRRLVLGAEVSSMPAKGLLARKSRKNTVQEKMSANKDALDCFKKLVNALRRGLCLSRMKTLITRHI